MNYDSIEERLEWANQKVRTYCGPNFWFEFNRNERVFEAWEKRGPMRQMLFPVDVNGEPLPTITDWEIMHMIRFVRRRRTTQAEKRYYDDKEYKQWTNPSDYKPRTEIENKEWVDTSPKVKGVKRMRVSV